MIFINKKIKKSKDVLDKKDSITSMLTIGKVGASIYAANINALILGFL